jgi:hypothetical protein
VGLGRPRTRRSLARGGVRPSSEADARGGVRPSSEAETSWCGTRSSSETEIRPRGTATDRLVGRCGFLGRGPFFVLGCGYAERVLVFVGMFVCVLLFFERGVFLGYYGTLMAVPNNRRHSRSLLSPPPQPARWMSTSALPPHRRRPRHPSPLPARHHRRPNLPPPNLCSKVTLFL